MEYSNYDFVLDVFRIMLKGDEPQHAVMMSTFAHSNTYSTLLVRNW
jgi:hypothetical protein